MSTGNEKYFHRDTNSTHKETIKHKLGIKQFPFHTNLTLKHKENYDHE